MDSVDIGDKWLKSECRWCEHVKAQGLYSRGSNFKPTIEIAKNQTDLYLVAADDLVFIVCIMCFNRLQFTFNS